MALECKCGKRELPGEGTNTIGWSCPECGARYQRLNPDGQYDPDGEWIAMPKDIPIKSTGRVPSHGMYSQRIKDLIKQTRALHAQLENADIIELDVLQTTVDHVGKWDEQINNAMEKAPPLHKTNKGSVWKEIATAQRVRNETAELGLKILDRLKDKRGRGEEADGPPQIGEAELVEPNNSDDLSSPGGGDSPARK